MSIRMLQNLLPDRGKHDSEEDELRQKLDALFGLDPVRWNNSDASRRRMLCRLDLHFHHQRSHEAFEIEGADRFGFVRWARNLMQSAVSRRLITVAMITALLVVGLWFQFFGSLPTSIPAPASESYALTEYEFTVNELNANTHSLVNDSEVTTPSFDGVVYLECMSRGSSGSWTVDGSTQPFAIVPDGTGDISIYQRTQEFWPSQNENLNWRSIDVAPETPLVSGLCGDTRRPTIELITVSAP